MKRRENISPDITPLIDVVFLLLIFFLVSTVFKKEELALMLQLPDGIESAVELREKEVVVEVGLKQIAISGKVVALKELDDELALLPKKSPVQLLIDQSVPYEKVAHVLDRFQKFGLNQIALSVKP